MPVETFYKINTTPGTSALANMEKRWRMFQTRTRSEMRKVEQAFNRMQSKALATSKKQGQASEAAVRAISRISRESAKEIGHLQKMSQKGLIDTRAARAEMNKYKATVSKVIADIVRKFDQVGPKLSRSAVRALNRIEGEMRQVDRASTRTTQNLGRMGRAAKGVGRNFSMIFAGGAIGVVLGLGRALTAVSRNFRQFDLEMTRSMAIMSGATADMTRKMEEMAKKTAIALNLDPTDLAKGYFFLASAGLDAAQSLAALPEVALFAKAGAFDLATATDLSTDALSALGLKSDDAQENLKNLIFVQDNLVKANTLANATVREFSESLTNAAANAMRDLNIELESGLSVLAVWADAGKKGAEAGMRFEIVTRDLQRAFRNNREEFDRMNIEVFDSRGEFRAMADIISDMEVAFGDMSPEAKGAALAQLGFQDKSVKATRSLIGLSEVMRRYEAGLREAGGTTQKVADKQLKALDERIGKLTQRIKVWFQDGVAPAVEFMAKMAGSINANYRSATELTAAVKGLNDELGDLSNAHNALRTFQELANKQELSVGESADLESAIKTLADAFPSLISQVDEAGKAFDFYEERIADAIMAQKDLARINLSDTIGQALGILEEAERREAIAQRAVDRLPAQIEALKTATDPSVKALPKGGPKKRTMRSLVEESNRQFSVQNTRLLQSQALIRKTREEISNIIDLLGKEIVRDAFIAKGMAAFDATDLVNELHKIAEAKRKVAEASKTTVVKELEDDPNKNKPTADQLEAIAETREAALKTMKGFIKTLEVVGSLTDKERKLVQEVHTWRDRVRRQAEILNTKEEGFLVLQGKEREEAEELLANLQKQLGVAEAKLRLEAETVLKIREAAGEVTAMAVRGPDATDSFAGISQSVVSATEDYSRALKTLQIELGQGKISQEEYAESVKAIATAYEEALGRAYEKFLKNTGLTAKQAKALLDLIASGYGQIKKEADEAGKSTKKVTESTKQLITVLGSLSSALRGILRFADTFGDLDDDVRSLVGGLADAASGYEALARARAQHEAGNLTGTAYAFTQAASYIGIAGGVVSAISGLASIFKGRGDREEALAKQRAEEMRQLQEALRDNARSIRDSIDDLINSERLLPDVGADKALRLQGALTAVQELQPGYGSGDADSRRAFREAIAEFFEALEASGLDEEQKYRNYFDDLIASGIGGFNRAFERTMSEGLSELLDGLFTNLGGFSNTVDGAVNALSVFSSFISQDVGESLQFFVDFLLGNVAGLSPKLAGDLAGIDISTAEGREKLKTLLADMADSLVKKNTSEFLLGGALSSNQLEAIMNALQGFLTGGDGASGPDSGSTIYQRSITTTQAARQIGLAEAMLFVDNEQLVALKAIVGLLGGTASSRTTQISNVLGSISTSNGRMMAPSQAMGLHSNVLINNRISLDTLPTDDQIDELVNRSADAMKRKMADDIRAYLRRRA